ncbi:hypothetical protein ATANTOWER_011160 [Ataeniobius toweri]|uniref:Uncharacterized protein n=1 Tax=Ataeniobius toweri TaxID=208326 RepID=A0ABU7CAI7_9TELE|nr:hypothetical protein [Ataeniobius toweri]
MTRCQKSHYSSAGSKSWGTLRAKTGNMPSTVLDVGICHGSTCPGLYAFPTNSPNILAMLHLEKWSTETLRRVLGQVAPLASHNP